LFLKDILINYYHKLLVYFGHRHELLVFVVVRHELLWCHDMVLVTSGSTLQILGTSIHK
jgi:hypothetical protein